MAPWPSVVLDTAGLWAVARNDSEDARAVLAASGAAGVRVLVPTAVLAETLLGDRRDARANQVVGRLEVVARLTVALSEASPQSRTGGSRLGSGAAASGKSR